jgi:hypothetical protein
MTLTYEQWQALLDTAKEIGAKANDKSSNLKLGDKLKDALYANADKIQSLLNSFASSGGVITQEQADQLNEEIRLAKKNLLEAEAKKTKIRLAIYVSATIAVIGVLWFITKDR